MGGALLAQPVDGRAQRAHDQDAAGDQGRDGIGEGAALAALHSVLGTGGALLGVVPRAGVTPSAVVVSRTGLAPGARVMSRAGVVRRTRVTTL
ncbi:hypothetical protein, partial [Streptomyces mirabilis]|uniref:hypothetical protein n=1 Tax=Streptomyces mirabilis TaxID=68239 RepID=UPI003822F185